MKTLIINGSPRPNGNTAALLRELKAQLEGEVLEISAFYDHIAPCLDKGNIAEMGEHKTLLLQNGVYAKLWNAQQELERYAKGGNCDAAERI